MNIQINIKVRLWRDATRPCKSVEQGKSEKASQNKNNQAGIWKELDVEVAGRIRYILGRWKSMVNGPHAKIREIKETCWRAFIHSA